MAAELTVDVIANPILNRPYDAPSRWFEIGPKGPTGVIREGRRPSESLVPIAPIRKGTTTGTGAFQPTLDVDTITAERREGNQLINDLRREVDRWRHYDYARVTPTTRKLLQHWADPTRENRVLYCQREAVETAVFLAEWPAGTVTPTGAAGSPSRTTSTTPACRGRP